MGLGWEERRIGRIIGVIALTVRDRVMVVSLGTVSELLIDDFGGGGGSEGEEWWSLGGRLGLDVGLLGPREGRGRVRARYGSFGVSSWSCCRSEWDIQRSGPTRRDFEGSAAYLDDNGR
jgi:hypothetical protein